MKLKRVCVYCASSRKLDPAYFDAAYRLGEVLAEASDSVVYGGGSEGLMGRLADGVLACGGQIIGVIPKFMDELEWGHTSLTELCIVGNMHERKNMMLADADAVVALPGGSGTLEELTEAITFKRLGIFLQPIVLVNTRGFFDRYVDLLEHCITEGLMDPRHRDMWSVVSEPDAVPEAIRCAPNWSKNARSFAAVS